jgi:polysaccharide export outer membrane protein
MRNFDVRIVTGWLLVFLFQLLLVGIPHGLATAAEPGGNPNVQAAPTPAYLIGPGDVLEIVVWKEPDLSRTLRVKTDGRISVPLVGDVQAAGKSTEELSQLLVKRFSELVSQPSVSVILTENRSCRYYVIGKVRQPGEYLIESPITVLQAIGRAGGFADWATTSDITIVRRKAAKEDILKFDYEAAVKQSNVQQNILVETGDTIVVP